MKNVYLDRHVDRMSDLCASNLIPNTLNGMNNLNYHIQEMLTALSNIDYAADGRNPAVMRKTNAYRNTLSKLSDELRIITVKLDDAYLPLIAKDIREDVE